MTNNTLRSPHDTGRNEYTRPAETARNRRKRKYRYIGITMKQVVQELEHYNNTFKVTKVDIGAHFDDIIFPTKNYIMAFKAVKRSEDK